MDKDKLFEKYRDAYLSQVLSANKVKDDEMNAAREFVTSRLSEDDSNMDEVIEDLQINMRLAERSEYADPSPMNGGNSKPKPSTAKDSYNFGRKFVENKKKRFR